MWEERAWRDILLKYQDKKYNLMYAFLSEEQDLKFNMMLLMIVVDSLFLGYIQNIAWDQVWSLFGIF